MKQFFTILIVLTTTLTFSQYCIIPDEDFKPFLIPFYGADILISLDSISCNGIVRFKSTKKNAEYAIIEAKASGFFGSSFFPSEDSISISYDGSQISKYVRYHKFSNEVDTAAFLVFDANSRLIFQQERFELNCGTGAPPDETRTIFTYNTAGELITLSTDLKWNYDSGTRPYKQWVNHLRTEYTFEEDQLVREYQQFNYFDEGLDTIFLDLFPLNEVNYTYENNILKEIHRQEWDFENHVWFNEFLSLYSYAGDTVFIETSHKMQDTSEWVKQQKVIKTSIDGEEDKITQLFDNESGSWVNNTWEQHKSSIVPDYDNYYKYKWIKEDPDWELRDKIEFEMVGDTIFEYRDYYWGSRNLFKYLFNGYGSLLVSKRYVYDNETFNWELKHELLNQYNEFNLPIQKADTRYSYYGEGDTISNIKNYFWDIMVNTYSFSEDNAMTIFPNPGKDKINIKTDFEIKNIQIFGSKGSLVKTSKTNCFDIAELSPGIYFIRLVPINGRTSTGKFIKL